MNFGTEYETYTTTMRRLYAAMLLPWLRRATPTFPTGPAATAMSARSRSSSSSIRRTWVIMALGFLQTLNMAAGDDSVHTGEPSTCYELAYGPDGESRALVRLHACSPSHIGLLVLCIGYIVCIQNYVIIIDFF